MTTRYKLTQGDNRPFIRLTLTQNGIPVDVSDLTTTVVVHFRAAGSDVVLSTLTCTKPAPNLGADGVVQFNFPGTTLDVEPGPYEGEVECDFDGEKQTIFDVLKFTVREQFA